MVLSRGDGLNSENEFVSLFISCTEHRTVVGYSLLMYEYLYLSNFLRYQ